MKFDPNFSSPPNIPPKTLEQIRAGWSVGAADKLPGEKKED
jgi:hypothetical protein